MQKRYMLKIFLKIFSCLYLNDRQAFAIKEQLRLLPYYLYQRRMKNKSCKDTKNFQIVNKIKQKGENKGDNINKQRSSLKFQERQIRIKVYLEKEQKEKNIWQPNRQTDRQNISGIYIDLMNLQKKKSEIYLKYQLRNKHFYIFLA